MEWKVHKVAGGASEGVKVSSRAGTPPPGKNTCYHAIPKAEIGGLCSKKGTGYLIEARGQQLQSTEEGLSRGDDRADRLR